MTIHGYRPKPKPVTWATVETRYGRPMREILETLYERHHSQTAIALILGVHPNTISNWWARCEMPELKPQRQRTYETHAARADESAQTGDGGR